MRLVRILYQGKVFEVNLPVLDHEFFRHTSHTWLFKAHARRLLLTLNQLCSAHNNFVKNSSKGMLYSMCSG